MEGASSAVDRGVLTIRRHRAEDAADVARVFREAVRIIGAACYTREQVAAWSSAAADPAAFGAARGEGWTLVATEGDRLVAFGQLRPQDHVDMLYCAPSHAHRGIGTRLLGELLSDARSAGAVIVTAYVSLTARTFFEGAGFVTEAEEVVERQGVLLPRLRMRRALSRQWRGGPPAGAGGASHAGSLRQGIASTKASSACVDSRETAA